MIAGSLPTQELPGCARAGSGRLIWAWRLTMLLLCYVPFAYQLKVVAGDAALLLYDLLLLTAVALVAIAKPDDIRHVRRLTTPILVALTIMLVNALAQGIQTPAFPFIQGIRAILLPIGVCWLLLQVVQSERQLKVVVGILIVTAFLAAGNGLRQIVFGLSPAEWAFYTADSNASYANNLAYKVPSSMGAAHAFAAAMASTLMLMWLSWKQRILRPPTLLVSLITLALVGGLFASGVRAALGLVILWAVLMAVFGIIRLTAQFVARGQLIVNASVVAIIALMTTATAAALIYVINSPLYEEVERLFQAIISLSELTSGQVRDGSSEARLEDVREVWRNVGFAPFGQGLGSFASVDNQLMVALGETGYVGAAAYLALMLTLAAAALRQMLIRANRATAWIGFNMQILFLGLGITSPILLHPVASFYFAIAAFFVLADRRHFTHSGVIDTHGSSA